MKVIGIIDPKKEWMDNSSLGIYKLCPRKFFLRVEQEITGATTSSALTTGTHCHTSKATYLKAKMKGHDHETCKAMALHVLSRDMLTLEQPDPIRNETVVVRIMNTYFDKWKDEPYKTVEAEIGFAVDLDTFIWVGKIDAIKQLDAYGTLVEETKTTTIIGERWPMRTKPNSQIDGYVGAWYINTGEMPYGAILDVIPLFDETTVKDKKTIIKKQPFRLITTRSLKDIDNWMINTNEWYHKLIQSKDSGVWPMNTDVCAPLVGFTCEYIPICLEYISVRDVQSMNISSIYKREKWEPWEISEIKAAIQSTEKEPKS